jgi:hypothetical protein
MTNVSAGLELELSSFSNSIIDFGEQSARILDGTARTLVNTARILDGTV